MNISELLNSNEIVTNIANRFNIDQHQASAAVQSAIPLILGGLGRNAQSPEGAQSINNALATKHDGSILDNMTSFFGQGQAAQQDGQGILNHVFGNQVQNVQAGVAQKSGISMEKIGPVIAMLAPIVMAYLSRKKQQDNVTNAGGLGDLIGSIAGGNNSQTQAGGGLIGMVSGFLDKNKDGNMLDDIVGMFGKKQ